MGAAAGIMGASTVLGIAAQQQAAEANRLISEYNAKNLEAQAVDAIARGREAEENLAGDARKLVGEQRVAMAGQGIDLDTSRTAGRILDETERLYSEDVGRIRLNALREAWGLKEQAKGVRYAGALGQQTAAFNTIGAGLTGASQTMALAQDYRMRQRGGG
jgi:hypothetical protein